LWSHDEFDLVQEAVKWKKFLEKISEFYDVI
jgi:hypothetical protein